MSSIITESSSSPNITHPIINNSTTTKLLQSFTCIPLNHLNPTLPPPITATTTHQLLPTHQNIIIVSETITYRQIARHLTPIHSNAVIDIGCSSGMTTTLLEKQYHHVIGVDISQEMIDKAKKDYPIMEFHTFNCLNQPQLLDELIQQHNIKTIFVDIGGDRLVNTLLLFCQHLLQHYSPSLLVVKSRKLIQMITKHEIELNQEIFEQMCIEAKEQLFGGSKRKLWHPLRYPLKCNPITHLPICRYHNYRSCKKFDSQMVNNLSSQVLPIVEVDGCPYDHSCCHFCLENGHVAKNCELFLETAIFWKP
jgi:SAM-dependent methyltransferase